MPLLKEHTRAPGQRRILGCQPLDVAPQRIGERLGLARCTDQAADDAHRLEDLGERALIEQVHRHAALAQLGAQRGLEIGEAQDEVGLQVEDLVEVGVEETRHTRLLARLLGPHGVAAHANDEVAHPEAVECLGRLLGEADDPAGIPWGVVKEHSRRRYTAASSRVGTGTQCSRTSRRAASDLYASESASVHTRSPSSVPPKNGSAAT